MNSFFRIFGMTMFAKVNLCISATVAWAPGAEMYLNLETEEQSLAMRLHDQDPHRSARWPAM